MSSRRFTRQHVAESGDLITVKIEAERGGVVVLQIDDDVPSDLDPIAAIDLGKSLLRAGNFAAANRLRATIIRPELPAVDNVDITEGTTDHV